MTIACAGLLELKGSALGLLKSAFDADISYSGCLGLSPAISAQFTLKMCVAARNREQFTKNFIMGVEGRLRSSILIRLKTLSQMIVMISSESVPIYNFFHAGRANSGIIRNF